FPLDVFSPQGRGLAFVAEWLTPLSPAPSAAPSPHLSRRKTPAFGRGFPLGGFSSQGRGLAFVAGWLRPISPAPPAAPPAPRENSGLWPGFRSGFGGVAVRQVFLGRSCTLFIQQS